MKLGGKLTVLGYVPSDALYFGACNCGVRRYFLTWPDALAWRGNHDCPAC